MADNEAQSDGKEKSDAFVFFGATGDLAKKQIFPSLQAMAGRGHLDFPVIGVAKAGWDLDQLKQRARESVEKHGGLDEDAFAKLMERLHYIDGDYTDPATFDALRKELGEAQHPTHYLAIPPALFSKVVESLGKSGCAKGGRVIVEKPFGHDLATGSKVEQGIARKLPRTFDLPDRSLPRQAAGRKPPLLPLRQRLPRTDLEPTVRRERPDHDGRGVRRQRSGCLLRGERRDP